MEKAAENKKARKGKKDKTALLSLGRFHGWRF